jgi:23S rRNA (uridine2552-2'-O)-methyltransferase
MKIFQIIIEKFMKTNTGYRNKFVKLKTAKNRTTSSSTWLRRQLNDPFVAKAKLDNYRSRSAYKLIEIDEKFKLFKPGIKVVDLGAAPGGWSQVASSLIFTKSNKGLLIGVDLLEIEPIDGVTFITEDFYNDETKNIIIEKSGGQVDIVMSDMAANTIGHKATDHIRTLELCEVATEFAIQILKPGGHFIAKIFKGGLEGNLLQRVKSHFSIVKHFKPNSSRKESTEFYLIALNRKDN